MAVTYRAAQPGFDWEFLLRDVLANGSFATVDAGPSTSIDLQWNAGNGTTIFLQLTGEGINAADTRTLSAADFDGVSLA